MDWRAAYAWAVCVVTRYAWHFASDFPVLVPLARRPAGPSSPSRTRAGEGTPARLSAAPPGPFAAQGRGVERISAPLFLAMAGFLSALSGLMEDFLALEVVRKSSPASKIQRKP